MLNLKNKISNGLETSKNEAFGKSAKKNPFDDVTRDAAGHFELMFLAAAAHLTRRLHVVYGTRAAVFAEFPFLEIYDEKLAGREPDDLADEDADSWWQKTIFDWEKNCSEALPFRILREDCGFSPGATILLTIIGLIEEDARFGLVFETLNEFSDARRLTYGTARAWEKNDEFFGVDTIRKLSETALINFGDTEKPRAEWTLQTTPLLWSCLRGEKDFEKNQWFKFISDKSVTEFEKLILNPQIKENFAVLPMLVKTGEIQTVVVRGASHNGRKTLLKSLAKSLWLNVLEVDFRELKEENHWQILTTAAILSKALPIFELDAAPSETIEFPRAIKAAKIFGVTLGKQGGVSGAAIEKAVTFNLNLPDENERTAHWQRCLTAKGAENLTEIIERFRLSSGNIERAAALAKSYAALEKRRAVSLADVQKATRNLNRQAFDALAIYLEPLDADWSFLAVREETMSDLRQLEERCRIRENLRHYVGRNFRGQLQAGVRALFNGGSGTGKTFAARLLAGSLQKDVYRLDLASVVNKYIGETEKNLAKIFALVEELDVILLLDEGDALLTQRTAVSTANDRYANLETNYLLQRLESFEGILIVTTNANERIDSAFQRRMDTVIEFAAPTAYERSRIWDFHLPENHEITDEFLQEIVRRCELTGGQIRNIALHAASLALSEQEKLTAEHLEKAVRREYRKMSAVCPLKEKSSVNSAAERW